MRVKLGLVVVVKSQAVCPASERKERLLEDLLARGAPTGVVPHEGHRVVVGDHSPWHRDSWDIQVGPRDVLVEEDQGNVVAAPNPAVPARVNVAPDSLQYPTDQIINIHVSNVWPLGVARAAAMMLMGALVSLWLCIFVNCALPIGRFRNRRLSGSDEYLCYMELLPVLRAVLAGSAQPDIGSGGASCGWVNAAGCGQDNGGGDQCSAAKVHLDSAKQRVSFSIDPFRQASSACFFFLSAQGTMIDATVELP